jgi:hypothetical protein
VCRNTRYAAAHSPDVAVNSGGASASTITDTVKSTAIVAAGRNTLPANTADDAATAAIKPGPSACTAADATITNPNAVETARVTAAAAVLI